MYTKGYKDKQRIEIFKEHILPNISFDPTDWLDEHGFFNAPASTKYHGAYEGGLFDHCMNVAKALYNLTKCNDLSWERPESPFVVGFFHDLCKIDQYYTTDFGNDRKYEYAKDTLFTGHGDKSIMLLSTLTCLTEEEAACIRYHMGAFCEKEKWCEYTNAIHRYQNVLWTHMADMIAAHVIEV